MALSSDSSSTTQKTDSAVGRSMHQPSGTDSGISSGADSGAGLTGMNDQIEWRTINTIRTLSIDAVQKANSGHPGTPMALAPLVYVLWHDFLRFDPDDAIWPNRDRFVLSNGHASMLLYSALFLSQTKAVNDEYERLGTVSVSLDDIKNFRQLHGKCPGHPEYRLTTGVETTTGPLGQGVANSVGMAISERWLSKTYNQKGLPDVFNYRVYAVCGDGDMMEGVSSEAASIAGHLQLGNLCWIYDNNRITIEGSTELAFTENIKERFVGYGWHVQHVYDVNDLGKVRAALKEFQLTTDKPTLIILDTHIGFGSPNRQDTKEAHGEALGEEEVRLTKKAYGWPEEEKFLVPDGVIEHFRQGMLERGQAESKKWVANFKTYAEKFPKQAREIHQMQRRELPDGWDKDIPTFKTDAAGIASRDSSGKVMNAIAPLIPWMMGGAADLAPSTKTNLTFDGAGVFQEDSSGRNFHFGIREHAMGSIVNGMTLSKLRPFGATFFIFSDYQRPPIRLSALMEIPALHIFTHDSIGVGEDGPSHQPVEQLASLRAIPGLIVLRPADANEVSEAWRVIMKQKRHPVALVLTRQKLPTIDRTKYGAASGVARGGYILADTKDGSPEVILMATGSEVSLCLEAHEKLTAEGIRTRVVSLPSWELFEKQDQAYRRQVFPPEVTARVSVEQASTFGWQKYVGMDGATIGMTSFGASAPLKDLLGYFGFTVDNVVRAAKEQLTAKAKKGNSK